MEKKKNKNNKDFAYVNLQGTVVFSDVVRYDNNTKELHNYFLHLHFTISETLSLPEHEYPNHFFTSLHNLAACVL